MGSRCGCEVPGSIHHSLRRSRIAQARGQHYADAKSYRIESVEERTTSNDLERSWEKTILTAAESRVNRFHYEGRAGFGSARQVSDGKTVWTYHLDDHQYTEKPITRGESSEKRIIGDEEFAVIQAQSLRKTLADMAKPDKSATRLSDEVVTSNTRETPCYVIQVQSADMKRKPSEYSFERTIWIDRARETVLKTAEVAHTYMHTGTARVPIEEGVTTVYGLTELDGPIPGSLFTFVPPAEAKLVQEFPDMRKHGGGPDLTGQPARSWR